MRLGQQIGTLSDERLTLEAQLGTEQIAGHPHRFADNPAYGSVNDDGAWDLEATRRLRERVESFGIKLEVLALETDSVLKDIVRGREQGDAALNIAKHNIKVAGEAGIPILKYRFQPAGVLRTESTPGRGGAMYATFRFAEYDESKSAPFHIYNATRHNYLPISAEQAWDALGYFLEQTMPVAEAAGVKLALHPQDAPVPEDAGLQVQHVLNTPESMQRILDLYPSPSNGLNFCQGTFAEMYEDPATGVLEAIQHFGSQGKIFMVHFRNIVGGFGNFQEVYPDNGDVDMYQAIRAYQAVGYDGMLCPDHVPISSVDPDATRQFSFCLGYIRGLLQAAKAEAAA